PFVFRNRRTPTPRDHQPLDQTGFSLNLVNVNIYRTSGQIARAIAAPPSARHIPLSYGNHGGGWSAAWSRFPPATGQPSKPGHIAPAAKPPRPLAETDGRMDF